MSVGVSLLVCVVFGLVASQPLQLHSTLATSHFSIRDDEAVQGKVVVTSGDYACTFEFESKPVVDNTPRMNVSRVASIMRGLQEEGACVKSADIRGSVYEVCPGHALLQHTGQTTTTIGLYDNTAMNHERYTDGELCAAVRPMMPRSARVTYVCGAQKAVRAVTETSTCVFEVEVVLPFVCGVKEFEEDAGLLAAPEAHVDRPWMLEIEEYGDGEVSCYAASVDDLKIGGFSRSSTKSAEDAMSTLAWFTLGVARTDDYAVGTSRNSHSRPLLHSQHVVRGYNRLPFSERVLSVHVPAGPAVPVTLATVPAWPGGKPEFIQLLVKDSEPEYTTDM